MSMGISQLENRDWEFKGNVKIKGNLRQSPDRYYLEEFFKQKPALNAVIGLPGSDSTSPTAAALAAYTIANKDFEVLGTNAITTDIAYSTTEGGITLTAHSTTNDSTIILPHLDTNQTSWAQIKWGTENSVEWEAVIRTAASVASIGIWAGLKLTNTPTVATDADQVMFRFNTGDTNSTKWQLISSIGDTDTTTDTGLVVAASTIYKLRITIDAARKATFYINDTPYYTTAALTNDVDLIPYVGVISLTAATKVITLVSEKISREIFESS